jgi:hypothetical protein
LNQRQSTGRLQGFEILSINQILIINRRNIMDCHDEETIRQNRPTSDTAVKCGESDNDDNDNKQPKAMNGVLVT